MCHSCVTGVGQWYWFCHLEDTCHTYVTAVRHEDNSGVPVTLQIHIILVLLVHGMGTMVLLASPLRNASCLCYICETWGQWYCFCHLEDTCHTCVIGAWYGDNGIGNVTLKTCNILLTGVRHGDNGIAADTLKTHIMLVLHVWSMVLFLSPWRHMSYLCYRCETWRQWYC